MKTSRRALIIAAFFLLCPPLISATYISCAPMKSSINELKNYTSVTSESPKNICDPSYSPSTSIMAKTSQDDEQQVYDSVFKNKKIQLDTLAFQSKVSDPQMQGKDIIILIDVSCSKNNPGELTQKALKQQTLPLLDIPKIALKYFVDESLKMSALENLVQNDPCVLGVTPTGKIKVASLPLPNLNDPQIDKQNHLKVHNYAHAYQYLVEPQNSSTAFVKVGFADTGVDCSHPDLASNLDGSCGYNILNPGTLPTDNDGHGDHTAGTVAAVINNGVGIAGIAGNNTKIYAIKVIDVDSGSVESLQTGIQHAITQGVEVLNISIESQTRLPTVEDAVIDAVNAGIVVVMAAGNHSSRLGTDINVSPAMIGSVDGAITVGSIDAKDGKISQFSNFGNAVEISAAGSVDSSQVGQAGGIYSLSRSGLYQRLSGTSQAAPVIAGAAALLIQFFKHHHVSYTPAKIEQLIKASADMTGIDTAGGGRVINFSKLTRNAYKYAGVPLCDQ